MKKTMLLTALLVMVTSSAFAFSLAGDYLGPISIKFLGASSSSLYPADFVMGPGANDGVEDSWGVGRITEIWSDPTVGTPVKLWQDGNDGEELAYMMTGIDDHYVSMPGLVNGPGGTIDSVGGLFEVYLQAQGTFVESTRIEVAQPPIPQ